MVNCLTPIENVLLIFDAILSRKTTSTSQQHSSKYLETFPSKVDKMHVLHKYFAFQSSSLNYERFAPFLRT